jgi:hypothetical protein
MDYILEWTSIAFEKISLLSTYRLLLWRGSNQLIYFVDEIKRSDRDGWLTNNNTESV